MATIDPCGTFPSGEFFSQNKLPPGVEDYEYTRSFIIYATSASTGVLVDDLTINIMPVDDAEPGYGTPPGPGTTWRDQLRKLMTAQIPPLPRTSTTPLSLDEDFIALTSGIQRTSLDFTLKRKTCVILKLVGNFWTFSRDFSPVTTKQDYGGHYYNIEKHWLNPATGVVETPPANVDYPCVSFFSKTPCADNLNIRHSFSFNVELIMLIGNAEERLPLTIDPDVENKGSHP